MSFKKYANIPITHVMSATWSDDGLVFNKIASGVRSLYSRQDNKLNVREMLAMVSREYDISEDPSDYIFEAVRAVTAEVPNQNGDAFPKSELLRFDHRLGKHVYQTFILKPHHINHRADNPKTARGVVLDASYNKETPALDTCPTCNTRTAEVSNLDETGTKCKKCGEVVKDEFVELLIAIDTKKDATFAEGVRTGALDSLSMGCEAGYTDCSICDNRARSASQFCAHIKTGKKKQYKTASGTKMSFEKCGEVVFTEISRVDQPADPTALQREVFKFDNMPLHLESEMLIMATKIAKLTDKIPGGIGDNFDIRDMDPKEIGLGVKTEMEHSKDPAVVLDILTDHGAEDPEYYNKLQQMEKSKEAMRLKLAQLEKLAQDAETSPQMPFKTIGESIRWAETASSRLKGKISKLTAEKEEMARGAATEGRPFYAWEAAQYDSQIKSAKKYIAKLDEYISKARVLEASGEPWGKVMSRSMSKFFASKEAQQEQAIDDTLDELNRMHPDLYNNVVKNLEMDVGVADPMSIGDYAESLENKDVNKKDTPAEIGMKTEDSSAPKIMAAEKIMEDKIASQLDALVDLFKENTVVNTNTSNFANAYKKVMASVTDAGNIKVFTPAGSLFVIRPEDKPLNTDGTLNKSAAETLMNDVLKSVASDGIVATVNKYKTVLNPRMAQVLQHHVEDFAGGRDEGDKKPMHDGHMGDMKDKLGKPEKNTVGKEHSDRKDEAREKRDQGNSDVLEGHESDHAEELGKMKPATDDEHSDRRDNREKKPKNTLQDAVVDRKDGKPKTAKTAEDKDAVGEMCAQKDCGVAGPHKASEHEHGEDEESEEKDESPVDDSGDDEAEGLSLHKEELSDEDMEKLEEAVEEMLGLDLNKLSDMLNKKLQTDFNPNAQAPDMGAPAEMPAVAAAPAPAAPGMPMAAEKTAARIERLYKNRLEKAAKEKEDEIAKIKSDMVNGLQAKLLRAMVLAAKRQALNLEESPIKAAMFDVLSNELDIDAESFYPGMDSITASRIVEETSANGLVEFADTLVKRAMEFLDMSDEAFKAIEADVKNLRPAPVQVQHQATAKAVDHTARRAAVEGNLLLAPSNKEVTDVPSTGSRNNIRSALSATKVRRAGEKLVTK